MATSNRWRGIALTAGVALVAAALGSRFPLIGGPVFGILLGMLVRATGWVDVSFKPGITFSSKQVLQFAVVLFGAGLSLRQIIDTGADSLSVMLTTLITCLAAAWLLGRVLRISSPLTTLIGVGTAICGASAIAAASPVVEAEEQDVAYAISTIFLFNIAAVLIFPPLGRALGMDQGAFGLWAGTAINDTSSVVAAAYSYGQEAGTYATVVKLTRATMIIPIVLGLTGIRAARLRRADGAMAGGQASQVNLRKIIPWFIIWFLVAALANTAGLVPGPVAGWATSAGKFLIVVALAGVGLSADFKQLRRTGFKPILLGMALWAVVAVTGLLVQGVM